MGLLYASVVIKIFQQCSNAIGWTVFEVPSASEPDLMRMVSLSEWGDYICDCPGYQYRGECRHFEYADKNRCRWQEGDLPSQSEVEKANQWCPNCAAPTILVAKVDE